MILSFEKIFDIMSGERSIDKLIDNHAGSKKLSLELVMKRVAQFCFGWIGTAILGSSKSKGAFPLVQP